MATSHREQNRDATVYVGNIDERFTQELLSELMTQAGPVRQVHMPLDRVSQQHQGFGFVEYDTTLSAEYAAKILNAIRVWGKPLRVNKASADKQKTVDIGAELFINNLDQQVDEKMLYDAFSRFGGILRQPNIARDDNHVSKGFGFVSFDSFEASDAAIRDMHGTYMMSKEIIVEYAYKKDAKGERHGDEAERRLAAEGKKNNIVPERQTLPAAYHMTGPGGAPGAGSGANSEPLAAPPAAFSGTNGPIPTGPSTPINPGMPPYGMPPNPAGLGRGIPPPLAAFGGAQPGGRPIVLPPAPSGLPARPPPSSMGYAGPMDNFHRSAPPGFFPGAPGAPPGAPVGMQPPVGMPPGMYAAGMPPPPSFTPPGFAPPGAPAPNGFGSHR
jgi:splicing factor 3B subunit 4